MENGKVKRPAPALWATFILVSLLVCVVQASFSQGDCLEVTRASGERLSTLPGRVFTTALRVVNRSSTVRHYEARLGLPAGWRSVMPEVPFDLAPAQADIRLLSIAVPGAAPAGSYHLQYSATDNALPACRADCDIEIAVKPLKSLDLQLVEAPRFVVAGEKSRAVFSLRNTGNGVSRVRLSTRSTEGFTSQPDSSLVVLEGRESVTVRVTIEADPAVTQNLKNVLELRATLVEDTTVTVNASCMIELIPRMTAGSEQFHEIPLQAKLRAAGEESQIGAQVEIAGGGTIADSGTDRVDFLLRTPDIQARSVLGSRDEYRLSYVSDSYQVDLGDRSYDLSPLTELARYAFGIGGQVRLGDATAGGFINRTRFFSPAQKEQAGFLSYGVGPYSSVAVNYLRKEDTRESNVGTIRTLVRPFGQTDIDCEYGLSSLAGAPDHAFAAKVQGNEQWLSYDLRYVHAGPDFGGYYSDAELKSGSLNMHPWRDIRIEGYVRDERRNLLQDTALFTAPRDRYYQVGTGYGDFLAVYFRLNDQRDLLPVPKYSRRDESVQLRGGYASYAGDVFASADFGTSNEYVYKSEGPYRRYQLSANFRPEAHQNYGFTVEYAREQNLYSGGPMETWSGNVSAGLSIAEKLRASACLYGTRAVTPLVQTYSLAEVILEYQFPSKQTLTVRGRQSLFAPAVTPRDIAWLVEYSIPFGIPLSRLTAAGALRGRVEDAMTMNGVANVLLYAGGATAVTDESGEFFFPALKPDVYNIQPELGSVGIDHVSTVPVPFTVTVHGGQESRLNISLIRGATITGAVRVYDSLAAPVPNMVVELAGQTETLRRLTDGRGMFKFGNIRPGDWTLRIPEGELPAGHFLEHNSLAISLTPGAQRDTSFRLLPRKRMIRILQEQILEPEPERPFPHNPGKVKPGDCVILPGPGHRGYVVRIALLMTGEEAQVLVQDVAKATGLKAGVDRLTGGGFSVVVGPFKTKGDARAAIDRLGKM